MPANLSVLGLYQWDDTIFDNMQIPTGMTMSTLRDNLLAECAELEVLYPNPVVFKSLLGIWSLKEKPVWDKLYATTQLTYNPIENYDRQENSTTTDSRSVTASGSDTVAGTNAVTNGGTDTRATTYGGSDETSGSSTDSTEGSQTSTLSGTDTTTHRVSAYDASALVDQSSDSTAYGKSEDVDNSQESSHSESVTVEYGQTENVSETHGHTVNSTTGETTTYGKVDTTAGTQTVVNRIHGNIGVTTTQQMLQQEREIDTFNIYDIIIESFKARFCLLVY